MPKVKNLDERVETPLPRLNELLRTLPIGQKIYIDNTRDEILKIRENLTKKRAEIPGADQHLEYIETLLLADANGQLQFKL